jgi:hypothetical protein
LYTRILIFYCGVSADRVHRGRTLSRKWHLVCTFVAIVARSGRLTSWRWAHSSSGSGGAEDPILAFSRKNLADIVKRDSPGRLHQMLAQDTQQQNASEMDW